MSETENNLYNLKLKETYETYLDSRVKEIMINYTTLINYYVIYSIENIKSNNISIFDKGFSLISNIFIVILMYTRNLNITIHHTQKGILYYIEYITQITDKDDTMFFNLTLKDAVVYVYTKTIYDINEEIKSSHVMTKYENKLFYIIQSLINNYNNIVLFFSKIQLFKDNDISDKKEILLNIHLLFNEHILKYYNNIFSDKVNINLKNIEIAFEKVNSKNKDNEYETIDNILDDLDNSLK